jgi:hypothetical protein
VSFLHIDWEGEWSRFKWIRDPRHKPDSNPPPRDPTGSPSWPTRLPIKLDFGARCIGFDHVNVIPDAVGDCPIHIVVYHTHEEILPSSPPN